MSHTGYKGFSSKYRTIMSKILALLKQAEEKGGCHRKVAVTSAISAKAVLFWIISVIIIIIFLTLLVFDQKLFTMVKENTAENYAAKEKLTNIENILTDCARQANTNSDVIRKLSGNIESMDIRIKDNEDKFTELKEAADEKFKRLKETSDTQLSSIQSLIKEKKSLFNKISAIETEILNIKMENAARAASNTTTTIALIE